METPTLTAERLHALAELYKQGQVSNLMDRTLEKPLRHEADACQARLRQLQVDLAEFEQKYQCSSTEFYQQCAVTPRLRRLPRPQRVAAARRSAA